MLPGTAGQGITVATSGTLDGVTLNANLTLSDAAQRNVALSISNGLVLNGVLTLNNIQNSTGLFFNKGVQTLAGTGQVVLGGTQPNGEIRLGSDGATTLTVAAGVTIRGQGAITQNVNSTLDNRGTIVADVSGKPLNVYTNLNSFTNEGTLRATGGAILDVSAVNWTNTGLIEATTSTLTLRGNWTNAGGVITATSATTNLGGTFTMAQLGAFNRAGGVVNLNGVFDNRGKTLALSAGDGIVESRRGNDLGRHQSQRRAARR